MRLAGDGETPTRLARRLNFDLAVDPAVEGETRESSEVALVAEDSLLQHQLPSNDQTFKGLRRSDTCSIYYVRM